MKGQRSSTWRAILIMFHLLASLGRHDANAQLPAASHPAAKRFWRALENPVSLLQQDVPVRPSLIRLATANQVGLFLDRRIDPNQRISIQHHDESLRATLESIASEHDWAISYLPPVVYVGPRPTTLELATHLALEEKKLQELPMRTQHKWRETREVEWPRFTEPRALIEAWAAPIQSTIPGIERIHHDLWDHHALPPMSRLQRIAIISAGFSTAPSIQSDGTLRLIPLARSLRVKHRYTIQEKQQQTRGRRIQAQLVDLGQQFPDATVRLADRTIDVDGPWELHHLVQTALEGDQPNPVTASGVDSRLSRKRFTLTVKQQTIDAILSSVATQLDLELVWPENSIALRQSRINLTVKNATIGQLLSSILANQPWTYTLSQERLMIRAQPQP